MSKVVVTKVSNVDNGGGSYTLTLRVKVVPNAYPPTTDDVYTSGHMTKDDIVLSFAFANSPLSGETPYGSRVWEFTRTYSSPQTESSVTSGFVNTLSGSLVLLPTV